MDKVLVTGATGFIGKGLIQHLALQKYQIRVLVRKKIDYFSPEIEQFIGDLTSPATLINACESIDTVFHLGGYAHANNDNDITFNHHHDAVNFEGTKNLFKEAIQAKISKFIFFSSVKAVAETPNKMNEIWDKMPDTAYGLAKRKAEEYLLNTQANMHICILRPALVYGAGVKGNLASMLKTINRGLLPPLPETNHFRSMISVDDLCKASILAANTASANRQIYFVNDGKRYSARQIYIMMCKSLGKKIPNYGLPLWVFNFLAMSGNLIQKIKGRQLPFNNEAFKKLFSSPEYSVEKIMKDLNFKPEYDLEKALPDIVQQYRSLKEQN